MTRPPGAPKAIILGVLLAHSSSIRSRSWALAELPARTLRAEHGDGRRLVLVVSEIAAPADRRVGTDRGALNTHQAW